MSIEYVLIVILLVLTAAVVLIVCGALCLGAVIAVIEVKLWLEERKITIEWRKKEARDA